MRRIRLESIGVSRPRKRLFKRGSLVHAVEAGRVCLRASHYHPEDVQILINTGVYRDGHYAEPAFACFIQNKLGINVEFQGRQTLSFDLQNGGCGMLSAVYVLKTLIQSGAARVGMVVSSEANSDHRPDPSYTYPASGAALLLDISPQSSQGFGSFVFKTYAEYCDLYHAVVSLTRKKGRLYVRKKIGLEDAYLRYAKDVLAELLEREHLRLEDIDLFIPSQLSPAFIQQLAAELSFSIDKMHDTTHLFADTLTTSVFLALQDAMTQGRTGPEKNVVFLTFGSGVTIGAAIYYF